MLPLLPTYATNLTSDDHRRKADKSENPALAWATIFWNAGFEVEAGGWFVANDGD